MSSSYAFAGGGAAGGDVPDPADEDDFPTSSGEFNQVGVSSKYARSDHGHRGVPPERQITAGTGLSGGGTLAADRSLAVAYGTSAGTATEGNDSRVTGSAQKSANLSDLGSAATARTNLGVPSTARQITAGALLTGGGDLTADRTLAVADRGLLLRDAMQPSGRYETRSRMDSGVGSSGITSGTLYLVPIWLPSGLTISAITFVTGTTAGATLTNQWFALFNNSRVMLAVTSNDTTTAWGSNSAKTLSIATTAAGAAASYATTYEGVHYLGLVVTATTMPTIHSGGSANVALAGATPGVGGSNTGQTTPPAFPFTANAPTQGGPLAYAYVT
ncbi:hypothetical protein ACGFNU_21425 [Spirillospora sp. NPDC048911]|uniref:hypothetical protein n=1 Tax=Spirillospora sp. NPDC048911 TaxID=3364527 RepID=UPI0037233538